MDWFPFLSVAFFQLLVILLRIKFDKMCSFCANWQERGGKCKKHSFAISGNLFLLLFPKPKFHHQCCVFFRVLLCFLFTYAHALTHTLGAHIFVILVLAAQHVRWIQICARYFVLLLCLFFSVQHGDQFSHRFISFAMNSPIDRHSFFGNNAKNAQRTQHSTHIRAIEDGGREKERAKKNYVLSARFATHTSKGL